MKLTEYDSSQEELTDGYNYAMDKNSLELFTLWRFLSA